MARRMLALALPLQAPPPQTVQDEYTRSTNCWRRDARSGRLRGHRDDAGRDGVLQSDPQWQRRQRRSGIRPDDGPAAAFEQVTGARRKAHGLVDAIRGARLHRCPARAPVPPRRSGATPHHQDLQGREELPPRRRRHRVRAALAFVAPRSSCRPDISSPTATCRRRYCPSLTAAFASASCIRRRTGGPDPQGEAGRSRPARRQSRAR